MNAWTLVGLLSWGNESIASITNWNQTSIF